MDLIQISKPIEFYGSIQNIPESARTTLTQMDRRIHLNLQDGKQIICGVNNATRDEVIRTARVMFYQYEAKNAFIPLLFYVYRQPNGDIMEQVRIRIPGYWECHGCGFSSNKYFSRCFTCDSSEFILQHDEGWKRTVITKESK